MQYSPYIEISRKAYLDITICVKYHVDEISWRIEQHIYDLFIHDYLIAHFLGLQGLTL